jgi:hypothetical protein
MWIGCFWHCFLQWRHLNTSRGSSVADGHLSKCKEERETLVVAVVMLKRDCFFFWVVWILDKGMLYRYPPLLTSRSRKLSTLCMISTSPLASRASSPHNPDLKCSMTVSTRYTLHKSRQQTDLLRIASSRALALSATRLERKGILKSVVFWDVAPCRSDVSEVHTRSTLRQIPEEVIFRSHHRENLKSYKGNFVFKYMPRPLERNVGRSVRKYLDFNFKFHWLHIL